MFCRKSLVSGQNFDLFSKPVQSSTGAICILIVQSQAEFLTTMPGQRSKFHLWANILIFVTGRVNIFSYRLHQIFSDFFKKKFLRKITHLYFLMCVLSKNMWNWEKKQLFQSCIDWYWQPRICRLSSKLLTLGRQDAFLHAFPPITTSLIEI